MFAGVGPCRCNGLTQALAVFRIQSRINSAHALVCGTAGMKDTGWVQGRSLFANGHPAAMQSLLHGQAADDGDENSAGPAARCSRKVVRKLINAGPGRSLNRCNIQQRLYSGPCHLTDRMSHSCTGFQLVTQDVCKPPD